MWAEWYRVEMNWYICSSSLPLISNLNISLPSFGRNATYVHSYVDDSRSRERLVNRPRHGRRSPWMSSMVVGHDRQLEAKFIGSGRCLRRAGAQGGKGTCGPGIRRALGAAHSIPAFPFTPRRLPTLRLRVLLLSRCYLLPRFTSLSFIRVLLFRNFVLSVLLHAQVFNVKSS